MDNYELLLNVASARSRGEIDHAHTVQRKERMMTEIWLTEKWRPMDSIFLDAGLAAVGPPAPILTNSDHPPLKIRFLATRVAVQVFPVFCRGGKNAMPAQWWKQGTLEVVENGLSNEMKHRFWAILAKTCE